MNKFVLMGLVFLGSALNLFADDIKIEVNPENPVFNENFEVKFIIKTDVDGEPIINFNPLGVDVVDRSDVGTSTRITYINGESTVEKTMSVSYEMVSARVGAAFLRDISVNIGDKVIKHPTVKINILNEAKQTKDIFVRAEIDKDSVFVGESIVARYYLYTESSIPLSSMDIRKFPKLDKFLKRFHQENSQPERVRVDGKVYVRRIMYTAQLYANTPGRYKIDPISMKVQYASRQSPFGGFGFNLSMGQTRSKTISSKPLEVEVMSLPAAGMPSYFTGLVGKHKFALKLNKNKFIANEPIEIQLTVDGQGALELFEAPQLLNDPNLESFEKSSDFQISPNFTSTKKINYTYLGRGDVNLVDVSVPIAYFDSEKKEYITENLKIGNIEIAGVGQKTQGAQATLKDTQSKKECTPNTGTQLVSKTNDFDKFEPLFVPFNTFIFYSKEIFMALFCILFLVLFKILFNLYQGMGARQLSLYDQIYKHGVSYQLLYQILFPNGETSQSMGQKINNLPLSSECRNYFISLIDTLNKYFSKNGPEHKLVVHRKYFKELSKAMRKKSVGPQE